jgi:hypothetical protein
VQQNTGENRKKQQQIFQKDNDTLSITFFLLLSPALGYLVTRVLEALR